MTTKITLFTKREFVKKSTEEKILLLHENFTRPYLNSGENEAVKEIENYFREAINWPDNEYGGIYQSHERFKSLALKLP